MPASPANPPSGIAPGIPAPAASAPPTADSPVPPWRERLATALAAGCVIGLAYFYWSA